MAGSSAAFVKISPTPLTPTPAVEAVEAVEVLHFLDIGEYVDAVTQSVSQPDGKILALGHRQPPNSSYSPAFLIRLNEDSSLDTSDFNVVNIHVDSGDQVLHDAAVLENGGFIVCGTTTGDAGNTGGTNIFVARLLPDGTVDNSFDDDDDPTRDGVARFSLGAGDDHAAACTVDKDYHYITGFRTVEQDIFVAKIRNNGSFDMTFQNNGQGFYSLGEEQDIVTDMEIQPDGKLVIVGHRSMEGDVFIIRLFPNGTLDPSWRASKTSDSPGVTTAFSTRDGVVFIDAGDGNDTATSLLFEPNGKIVVVGHRWSEGDVFMLRLLPNGDLDTNFRNPTDPSSRGVAAFSLGEGQDQSQRVVMQPDGKLLLKGHYDGPTARRSAEVVIRLHHNGTLDESFAKDCKSCPNGNPRYTHPKGYVTFPRGFHVNVIPTKVSTPTRPVRKRSLRVRYTLQPSKAPTYDGCCGGGPPSNKYVSQTG